MKIAVIGATGMVGNVVLQVLKEQNFPITELIPVASEKSVGKIIEFGSLNFPVVNLEYIICTNVEAIIAYIAA